MAGADSYSPRNRYRQQFPGNNLNLWGIILNAVIGRMEEAKDGFLKLTFSGTRSLVVANDTTDEAHFAVIDYTGAGGTLTIPSLEKTYIARNGGTDLLVLTTGAGRTLTVPVGMVVGVICDAVNVDLVSDPSARAYTDAKVLQAYAGTFPGGSIPGGFIRTDPTTGAAEWVLIQTSDVQGLPDALAKAKRFSVAAAAAL